MPDMLVKLYAFQKADFFIQTQEGSGIKIRRPLAPEKHVVVKWVRDNFNVSWASECDIAFSRNPVQCFIAIGNENIMGFACYNVIYKGFFGPVGVREGDQKQGIGKTLLYSCLHAMTHDGYAYAIIGGASPTEFYSKTVGAVVIEGSAPGVYSGMFK